MQNKGPISLVIPCYNEASRGDFTNRLAKLNEEIDKDIVTHVIIVDDGSKDNTFEVITKFIEENNLKEIWSLLKLKKNAGKGIALLKGLSLAATLTPYVAYIDADLSISPSYLNDALTCVTINTVVCGHRIYKKEQTLPRKFASKLVKLCNKYTVGLKSKDTQCPFKIIPSQGFLKVKDSLKGYRWIFDIELLWELERRGYYISEKYVTFNNMDSISLSTAKALVRCAKDLADFKATRWERRIEYVRNKKKV